MKKTLALILAAIVVFALFAGCGSKSEPAAAEAPAAAPAAEAPAAAPAAGDDFDTWKAYIMEYVIAGAPDEDSAKVVVDALNAAATVDEVEAIQQLGVMFSSVGVLHFDDWVAAGKPAADTSDMGTPPVSGEPTGEASGEPAA